MSATDLDSTDLYQFGGGELRIMGGDYGRIILEGTTEEACRALNSIIEATRRGDRIDECDLGIAIHHGETPQLEIRHAGREGTPERGVPADAGGPDTVGKEGVAAEGAAGGTLAGKP